jgi:HD domain
MTAIAAFPFVDDLLVPFTNALGRDLVAYRNHVTRVLNFAFALAPQLYEVAEPVLVAAAFHDLGIWTDDTFDYLGPSRRLAREYLSSRGLSGLAPEVEAIIERHHKLRPYRGLFAASVECFRRADLVDVSLGLIRSGLEVQYIREVRSALPNSGFHARLAALTLRQFMRTPLRPLPMVQW